MKKQRTREELERLVAAEVALSRKCPRSFAIHIEAKPEGGWDADVSPSKPNGRVDPGCVLRVKAVAARFRVDYDLIS